MPAFGEFTPGEVGSLDYTVVNAVDPHDWLVVGVGFMACMRHLAVNLLPPGCLLAASTASNPISRVAERMLRVSLASSRACLHDGRLARTNR